MAIAWRGQGPENELVATYKPNQKNKIERAAKRVRVIVMFFENNRSRTTG